MLPDGTRNWKQSLRVQVSGFTPGMGAAFLSHPQAAGCKEFAVIGGLECVLVREADRDLSHDVGALGERDHPGGGTAGPDTRKLVQLGMLSVGVSADLVDR